MEKDILEEDSSSGDEITIEDRTALKQYCMESKKLKQQIQENNEKHKKIRKIEKEQKKYLTEWMHTQESQSYVMPRSLYKQADKTMAKDGLPRVPPYLRVVKSTTDNTITPDIAKASIIEVDDNEDKEKVIEAILDNVRGMIRKTKETVKVTDTLEKGVSVMDIDEVPEEIAKHMIQLHKAKHTPKAEPKELKEKLKKIEPTVKQFLEKMGKKSQEIKLENGEEGKICKKESIKSPKITLGIFNDCLRKTFETHNDLSDLEHKKIFLRYLLLVMDSLPKTKSERIFYKST